MDTGPIRVSGARNGVDGYGRGWCNWTTQQRVGGTCLSGFEMGNPAYAEGEDGGPQYLNKEAMLKLADRIDELVGKV